ncbi:NmrA family NAD(P)-binding protein [Lacticaseibacillus saniviri]|uniref:NmrA family NAD(P)-binding protein n=1 Tax=Lacticaseibacillus saniviri TaxID=931533 RepID=UPI000B197D1F|nr:NmrA family NAD(P)-binding protein [Lacticaseibacillus saniviri]
MSKQLIVVTGATGFIASHIIAQLLQQGHQVRATVRSLAKVELVKGMLTQAGIHNLINCPSSKPISPQIPTGIR